MLLRKLVMTYQTKRPYILEESNLQSSACIIRGTTFSFSNLPCSVEHVRTKVTHVYQLVIFVMNSINNLNMLYDIFINLFHIMNFWDGIDTQHLCVENCICSDCGLTGCGTMKEGTSMFFRNVCVRLNDYTVSQSRRPQFEQSLPLKPQNVFSLSSKLSEFFFHYLFKNL
jgi:hypothetical protein